MKRFILIFLIVLLVGCTKKEIKKEERILSKGELVCVYKESRVNENLIYSSYYSFKFNDNGILEGATNVELVEFDGSLDSVKDRYKKELLENIKEYNNIDGISVSKSIEKDKYYFTVDMDNSKMNNKTKEKFLLDKDRITLYNIFTNNKYTCE